MSPKLKAIDVPSMRMLSNADLEMIFSPTMFSSSLSLESALAGFLGGEGDASGIFFATFSGVTG